MNKPGIILVGASGHARSCIDVIEEQEKYRIAGLVGTTLEKGEKQLGYPVIATDEDMPDLINYFQYALITVGYIRSAKTRVNLFQMVSALGFDLPVIVSPRAHVSRHAVLGNGTIVMHGATVNTRAVIGENCIINSHSLIEHDSKVGDHSHVATGAILNGAVIVGERSFLGSGCVIKENTCIGDDCLIGMGANVRHDVGNAGRFVGITEH
jgi:sugar O-acyltransferase (sialic acid O-acetyltransferase NeuD family)